MIPRRGRRVAWRILALAITLLVAAGAILWTQPYAFMAVALRAAYAWRGVSARAIDVGGETWPYLECGDPSKPAVLLLHGFGTSREAMMECMSWMSADRHLVAPDLPGFGQHALDPAVTPDAAFYVSRIVSFMDAMGLKTVDLVGTSMGGALAAELAIRHPDRVRRVVLLAPAGVTPPVRNDFMRRIEEGFNPLDLHTAEDFQRVTHLVFHHPPPAPTPVVRYYVAEAQRRSATTARVVEAMGPFLRNGLDGRLGGVRAPTLVVWGEHDQVTDPSMLQVFRDGIPGAAGHLVPDAGHVATWDNPGVVRPLVVPFILAP